MKKITRSVLLVAVAVSSVTAQENKNKAIFKERNLGFYEQIKKGNEAFNAPKTTTPMVFKMDYSNVDLPKSASEFKTVFAQKPESQGETNTCWCFSTTSFYESEIKRLSNQDVQLSELYTVYWETVEKAKLFVETRGTSAFDEGSETNAVARMMKKYGVVPLDAYNGMKAGQPFHDHKKMFEELKAYLDGVKKTTAWNSDAVVAT
ncbi:MAG: peptidase C1, partial [Bacteroidia bacterium]|nr:peptidase C1 [Bacteroidia bacterium]